MQSHFINLELKIFKLRLSKHQQTQNMNSKVMHILKIDNNLYNGHHLNTLKQTSIIFYIFLLHLNSLLQKMLG